MTPSDKNHPCRIFFVVGLFLFLWLIAEGAVEYIGLHITLLVMSAVIAIWLNNLPPDKNSDESNEMEIVDVVEQYYQGKYYYDGTTRHKVNGELYELMAGVGDAGNFVEAAKWFRKSAEQNYAKAQYYLGVCCYNGQGVKKDMLEAAIWFRKSAEQDFSEAQRVLGICYDLGEGVPQDHAKAVRWYRKAAEQNNTRAQYALGVCYYNGEGVEKDYVKAAIWFRKAAEQNDAEAQRNLGVCYDNGEGVEKDVVEAVKWYRKAADQGHADAQHYLGWCYANGKGVETNAVEAYKWYHLASAQGNESAKKNLSIREQKMTPEQIAEGQKLAREFKPQKLPSAGGDFLSMDISGAHP